MSRREVETMRARLLRTSRGPHVHGAAAYAIAGDAVGAEGHDQASFAAVRRAWRARAWTFSRRWRLFFAMALGAALMTLGLFGSLIVVATAGIKLLLAAALVYAAVRTAVGFARAPAAGRPPAS
jgi:hypothetical protein